MPATERWWDAAPVVEDGGDDWWKSAPEANDTGPAPPALAGRSSELRQGRAPSLLERGWEAARQAIFGSEDRAEAKAAGVGLQPTPADMAEAGMAGAAFMGGPALALRGAGALAGRLPGAAGKALGWAASHPRATMAAVEAAPEVVQGDVAGAVVGAGLGALEGTALGAPARAIRKGAGGVVKEAAGAALAKAAPKAAQAASRGKAVATAHNDLMAFAKGIAKENPKIGQKIHVLLDDAGKPVRVLTPDQAGAAARKGLKTTWVKNLWSGGI